MASREHGKAKPLKAPKKAAKELDEDDLAYQQKKKAEAAAAAKVAADLKGGKKLGAGLQKSGKK